MADGFPCSHPPGLCPSRPPLCLTPSVPIIRACSHPRYAWHRSAPRPDTRHQATDLTAAGAFLSTPGTCPCLNRGLLLRTLLHPSPIQSRAHWQDTRAAPQMDGNVETLPDPTGDGGSLLCPREKCHDLAQLLTSDVIPTHQSDGDVYAQWNTASADVGIDDSRARKVLGYRNKFSNAQTVSGL